jgi:hypothetical protein
MTQRWAGIGRWLRVEAPFVVVVVAMVAPVPYLILAPSHWRRGSAAIALAVLLAAAIRAALPAERVGLLSIRGRVRDTAFLTLVGGVILAVAIRLH